MSYSKVIAETDDGTTVSEGSYANTGSVDYRLAIRQGKDVRVDPQRDPAIGDRNGMGLIAFGANPPGNASSNASTREAWTRFKKDSGFVAPTGGYQLASASLRQSRYFYKYTDEGGWYADDSQEVVYNEWTSPLNNSWLDLENFRINPYADLELYHIMSDRSTASDVTAQGNLQEGGAERFFNRIKTLIASGGDAQFCHFMFSQTQQFPRSRYWAYSMVASNNTVVPARFKPTLLTKWMKTHALNAVGGASIQMSDGTAIFLRKVGTALNLYYQRINQSTPTLIKRLPTSSADDSYFYKIDGEAFQAFALCRDNSNNLFIVGMDGREAADTGNAWRPFLVNAMKYNGNYSWSYYSPTSAGENTLPANYTSRGMPNNFSAIWIPASDYGSAGQLAILFSHRDSQWATYQVGLYTMYAGWLMGDSSPGRRANVNYVDPYSVQSYWRPMNSVGTGLDVVRVSATGLRFCSYCAASANDENDRHGAGWADIPSTHVVSKPTIMQETWLNAPHDPDGKARQIWMGESPTYHAIMRSGRLSVRKVSDDTLYREIDLTSLGLTNFPSTLQIQSSQAWDIIWDSLRNKFWIYYMDSQNNRNIRKVGYDPVANVIDSSYQLNGSVLGNSGDRIVSMRAPRLNLDPRCVILDVAMVTNVGDPTTLISIRDLTMNKAPGAPFIDAVASFNATSAKTLDYAFNDPGDVCSAHQVQIRRVSTMATVYDSGKTAPQALTSGKYRHNLPANTLSNDTQYQVRILTYDAVDQVGVWSDWVSFSTSATGGTVTITQPPADLAPLTASSLTVAWTYSNSTPSKVQTGYQVRVYNDVTQALLKDSGMVTSTATSYPITGLVSDVRVRIEVQAKDSSGGISGSGIRIMYPDFSKPPNPMIDVVPGEGYLEVRCTNPPPIGENPAAVSNQIARKEETEPDSAYKVIGTAPLNGVFKDFTVASEVRYRYKARSST